MLDVERLGHAARLVGTQRSMSEAHGPTVSGSLPTIPSKCASTLVVPAATPVARPFEPVAFETVATDGIVEIHVTSFVTSNVLASS